MSDPYELLEPRGDQIARIGDAIRERVDAMRRPLWREWVDLFVARPVFASAATLAAAAALLVATPGGALLLVAARWWLG